MENLQELDIIITLIAGTLVIFIMAGVIVLSVIKYQKNVLRQKEILRKAEKKFQNDLLDATIIAADLERESVAKNLHDDIGPITNIIKLNNNRLKKTNTNEARAQEIIAANDHLLIEINESIRSIYHGLVNPTLNRFGFISALEQLCRKISTASSVNIENNLQESELKLERKTEVQLFRICKEVLNNILKHSNPSEIKLNLTVKDDLLSISVKYNGIGVNDEQVKTIMENNQGLGLKSIYSRVQIIEGSVNYYTPAGEDNHILIQMPFKSEINAA